MPDVADIAALTIVRRTPVQDRQALANMFPHWGAPGGVPSESAFAGLWAQLFGPHTPWMRGGDTDSDDDSRVARWALVPRADPTSDPLAHCDTVRRTAYIRRPGSSTVERVSTYCVFAAFTPPQHRGHGYARHMLRLLHYVLAPRAALPPFPASWGTPPAECFGDAACSTLYSSVGTQFYAEATIGEDRPGWIAQTAPVRVWKVPAARGGEKGGKSEGAEVMGAGDGSDWDWEWLDVTAVGELERVATQRIVDLLRETPPDSGKVRVALAFDGWLRWRPMRADAIAPVIGRAGEGYVPRTARCGVRLPANKDGIRPVFTYTVETRMDAVDTTDATGGASTSEGSEGSDGKDSAGGTVLQLEHVDPAVPFGAVLAAARGEGCATIELHGGFDGWDADCDPALVTSKCFPALAQYTLGDESVEWLSCEQ